MLWILSDFKDCEQLPRDDLELVDAGVQTEDISDEVDAKVTRDQQTQTEEMQVEEESESHVKVITLNSNFSKHVAFALSRWRAWCPAWLGRLWRMVCLSCLMRRWAEYLNCDYSQKIKSYFRNEKYCQTGSCFPFKLGNIYLYFKIYLNPVLSMFQAKLYLIEDLNIAGCVDKMCLQSFPSPFPEQCSHAACVYDDIICKLGQVL